jgi:hypothetical protein
MDGMGLGLVAPNAAIGANISDKIKVELHREYLKFMFEPFYLTLIQGH